MPESRAEQITRWELDGMLEPTCSGCKPFYDSPGLPCQVVEPNHKPSVGCESGQRPHCSCPICWG